MKDTEIEEIARKLHHKIIVIDCLIGGAESFERILKGGVTAGNITVGGASQRYGFKQALKMICETYDLIDINPDKLLLVKTASDILSAKVEKKLGVIIGFQGALPIGEEIYLLSAFHRLGLRILGLTYNETIATGSGCTEPYDTGLTHFGYQVLKECARLGIIIDLSHAGEKTCWDVLEATNVPVIFSHSNSSSIAKNKRNISDKMIKACAETGGVIGASSYSSFTGASQTMWPDLEDYLDMIEHMIDVAGIKHIGIGTDMFEGRTELSWRLTTAKKFSEIFKEYSSFKTRHVQGFTSSVYFPRITEGLVRRGYSNKDISCILGENWLRVFKKNWN